MLGRTGHTSTYQKDHQSTHTPPPQQQQHSPTKRFVHFQEILLSEILSADYIIYACPIGEHAPEEACTIPEEETSVLCFRDMQFTQSFRVTQFDPV